MSPAFVRARHCLSGLLWYACAIAAFGDPGASAWSPLPSRTNDTPGFVFTPSPPDWKTHTIYQIITDRFADGDPLNNSAHPEAPHNPLSMEGIHGGDFRGITRHLDYIRYLGFDAIWISPVHYNYRGAYHGYHITDFNRIDPHWGSLDDLRELIDQAHARGMRVIVDVVFNHLARLLTSDDPGFSAYSETPYTLRWQSETDRFAPPFDDLSLFHAHGSIQDWEHPIQSVLGDLRGLADLKTEDPRVRDWLIEIHLALIAATDVDGFRVDTAHHVDLESWQAIIPRIREGAAALGKTNFIVFAESLRHRDDLVAPLTREGGFTSALYYPYFFTLQEIWGRRGPTRLIRERWNHRADYGSAADILVTFGDNHDRERLLNERYLDGDVGRLKALLSMLYASPGIPCFYYGTEQEFSGGKGHSAREPMFNPAVPGPTDVLDAAAPVAQWTRKLNLLRRMYPVLQSGATSVLHAEDTAGLFAFTRRSSDRLCIVIINNSTESRDLDPAWFEDGAGLDLKAGWIDLAGDDGALVPRPARIAADTTQFWIPANLYRPPPPSVTWTLPAHGARGIEIDAAVQIEFDRPVEPAGISAILLGQPVDARSMQWTNGNRSLLIQPSERLPDQTQIPWSITLPATGDRYESWFHTGRIPGRSQYPLAAFTADGSLDAGARLVISNEQAELHAAFDRDTGMLYLATRPASTNEDRFIMIAFSNHARTVKAPWQKQGTVPAYDVLISHEGESDYTSIRGATGPHWSYCRKRGVFEASVRIAEPDMAPPADVQVRTTAYQTRDQGEWIEGSALPDRNGFTRLVFED